MENDHVLNVNNLPVKHIDVAVAPQTPAPPHSQVKGLVEKEVAESIVREYVKNSITNNAAPIVALSKGKEKETSASSRRNIKGATRTANNKGVRGNNLPKSK